MGWRAKKLSTGGARGNGGTVLISSCKCNFCLYLDIQVYYLDIQAITTLLAFYWFFVLVLLFIHFSILQPLFWKVTFSGIQKPTPPTVFNLQVSDWVHCQEETGAYYQLSWFTYKLVEFFFKLFILQKKGWTFQKIPQNLLAFFLPKRENWVYTHTHTHTYIYICVANSTTIIILTNLM